MTQEQALKAIEIIKRLDRVHSTSTIDYTSDQRGKRIVFYKLKSFGEQFNLTRYQIYSLAECFREDLLIVKKAYYIPRDKLLFYLFRNVKDIGYMYYPKHREEKRK